MWFLLLCSVVWGGELRVTARVPAELRIDGLPVLQAFQPLDATVEVPPGPHRAEVLTHGAPQPLDFSVVEGVPTLLVIGRIGLSAEVLYDRVAPAAVPQVQVSIRHQGDEGVMVLLDGERLAVSGGRQLSLVRPAGTHNLEIRSADGTLIWARGELMLEGAEAVVLQVSAGKVPEVAGGSSRFWSTGR
ncbi:MAG: hypothetical protein JXX28_09350 [Deltaproteobacteria bacterium]|nr:hypothetical protein [Deltaproteobacteria bacterium]